MMRIKPIIALFLICLLLIVTCSSAFSVTEDPTKWRDEKSHNRWTQSIIFGNAAFTSYKDQSTVQKVEILEDAILLCVDQYNSSYSNKLISLNNMGIPEIPDSIDAINFTAGADHRTYTHRGWEHKYTEAEKNKGHSDIRKDILRNAVEFVFHFERCCSSSEQAEKTRNAMCCLLYITHILGDRFHSKTYYGAASMLILADDSKDSETVINDLRKCLPVLFPNQKSSVLKVNRKLVEISNEIVHCHRKYPDKNDWHKIDTKYAEMIKDLLKENIPNLLKHQIWFTNAFSLSNWNGI